MVQVEDEPRVLVRLLSRQHSIKSGIVRLLPMTDVLSFTTDAKARYTVGDENLHELDKAGGDPLTGEMAYKLPECPQESVVNIYMPFARHQEVITGRVKITVDYVNADGKQYNFVDVRQVDMSCAFRVFQRSRLIGDNDILLVVQLSSEADVPVRVFNQHLQLPKSLELVQSGQPTEINQVSRFQQYAYYIVKTIRLFFPQEKYTLLYKLKRLSSASESEDPKIVVGYALISDGTHIYTLSLNLIRNGEIYITVHVSILAEK